MADAAEDPAAEGEDGPPEPAPPSGPRFVIKVVSCRNLPEETSTVISYSYNTSPEDVEEPVLYEGTTEEFEEPPEGTEHKYNFTGEHVLSNITELLFYKLITQPLEFKVEGLEVPGKVSVSLVNLIWRPDPTPEDPDEDDYLPGAPGSFIRGWFPVLPNPEEEMDEEQKEKFPSNAEVYLDLSVSETLATEEELKELNILTFKIRSLHRLPKLWGPKEEETWEDVPVGEDHPYVYELRLKLPGEGGELKEIVAEPGELVAPEPEPAPPEEGEEGAEGDAAKEGEAAEGEGNENEASEDAEKKSSASGAASASAAPNGDAKPEDEFVQLQMTESRVSLAEEVKGSKVKFDFNYSASILPAGVALLRGMLSDRGRLVVEVQRKLRSEEEYVYAAKYHGEVKVDGAALLRPGETAALFRCPLEPAADYALPSEEELEATPPPGGEPEPEEGANPYLLAETYLLLELELRRPLVPKPKPPPPVLPKVGDLLPTRAPVEKAKEEKSGSAQFVADIESVVQELAEDYRLNFVSEEGAKLNPKEVEARRQQMIFQLNSTGRYYDFKEKLKRSVTRIVREKFHKEGIDAASDEGKMFMSTLYVHLQEEVNQTLKGIFKPQQVKALAAESEDQQGKVHREELRLAVEAEMNLNFPLASSHLNARIIAAPADPVLWYDYGVLNIRCGDVAKAEECLRESLSLDPRHTAALLAYGVLLCTRDKFADAETYLKAATEYSPNDVLAWSMLVLLYDIESRDLDRRAALKRVLTLEKTQGTGKKSAYLRAGCLACDLHGTQLVERAATQELLKNGASEELSLMLARAYLGVGQWTQCREHLAETLSRDKRCAVAMTMMGHSHFLELGWHAVKADKRAMASNAKEVMSWYEKALAQRTPHVEIAQYVRLAKLFLFLERNYEAKDTLLKACQHTPSATTWLGLGIACYRQKELDQAEEALSEANILDTKNPEVWAMLCLVAISTNKLDEGDLCLQRALKMGISTQETFPVESFMLEQIGQLLFTAGRYSLAAAALQRALNSSRSPSLLVLLARTNIQDNDLPAAVTNYMQVVEDYSNEAPPTALKRECLEQLVVLSTKLKRNTDVAKFQTMLRKLPP